ncbi:MAG: class I SAM-dependent methyltransferase [Pseudonocardiaceae bacterium]
MSYDEDYYRDNGQLADRPALGYYVRLLRRYVGPGPYLDFGCGTGHLVRRMSTVAPAAGFETSEYSAHQARHTAPGCPVYTRVDDIPSAHFGGIAAIHVLEHLPDDLAADSLRAWHRALTPTGRMLVVMPDPAGRARALLGERWMGYRDETHINLKPHAQWRRFLQQHGMRVVREGSDGLWNVPYRRLPKLVDAAVHAGPALLQFLSGRLLLPPGSGESSIFVLARA